MNQRQGPGSGSGPTRRTALSALALSIAAPVGSLSHAQSAYPERPVRLLVGFPPGTGPDFVARVLAQKLGENLKQTVVVDNRAGAGGLLGAQEAAWAAADGYTLYLGTVAEMGIAPNSYSRLPYDIRKDFTPISHVASGDFAFVVPQNHPAKTIREYVEWAKTKDPAFVATFGAGTPGHFGAAIFANAAGFKVEPVHFKSTGDAVTAVINGEVPGLFGTIALVATNVKGGKLKALGTTGGTRSTVFPELPTFKESGYKEVEFDAWFGLYGPARAPAAVVEWLNAETAKAMQAPEVRTKLSEAGMVAAGSRRDDFDRMIAGDLDKWAKAVKATGFRAD